MTTAQHVAGPRRGVALLLAASGLLAAVTLTPAPRAEAGERPVLRNASFGASGTAAPPAVVDVSTAGQLSSALSSAVPGRTIRLADGTYRGNFSLRTSGTASAPIRITGSRRAVLDGGTLASGYVLHLDRADYVQVDGITVRNGQKAVVLDQSSHVTLTRLDLRSTGSEVLLLRNYSCDNVVSDSEIHDSGRVTAGYGEGVYIGLSRSNWSSAGQSRTNGGPDRSDRNTVVGNHIYATTAENVDVKEGTTGGRISGNRFDATGISGANYADSWVDIAGNGYLVENNVGVNAGAVLVDGYQTHVIVSGWADGNVFRGNASAVNGPGYGIAIATPSSGNVVFAGNTATGARKGLTNVTVVP
jgi:hypothetical protein